MRKIGGLASARTETRPVRTFQRSHRWTHRRHVDVYDVLAWCLFTALSAAVVLAFCAIAWLVAP